MMATNSLMGLQSSLMVATKLPDGGYKAPWWWLQAP